MSSLQRAFGEESIRTGVVAKNYSEAISAAGELLVLAGSAKDEYVGAMVRVVDELGPYIVLIEGFALAHAKPDDGVLENGLALVSLESPVDFGSGKMVSIVFALASINHDSHIDTLGELAELLADETLRDSLLNAVDSEQIRNLFGNRLGE